MIVIVFGLPGSGKSYFAERLAKTMHADYLNTDQLRKELFSNPTYSEEEKRIIYKKLLEEMYEHAHSKRSLILDGTFCKKDIRDQFLKLAGDLCVDLRWIEIVATENIIKQRTSKERKYSDADYSIYQKLKQQFEPLIIPQLLRLTSNNENINEMINEAKCFLEN